MPLEAVSIISDLDIASPAGPETKREGDDHIRNIKRAIRTLITGVPGAAAPTQSSLVGGTLALTSASCAVLPEGVATSGTLQTIGVGGVINGAIVLLFAGDPARPVTVTQAATGTGRIILRGGVNFILDNNEKYLLLRRDGNLFREIIRFNSGIPFSAASNIDFLGDISFEDASDVQVDFLGRRSTNGTVAVHSFRGINVSGSEKELAAIVAKLEDRTTGSEDGKLELGITRNGATRLVQLGCRDGVVVGVPVGSYKGDGTLNAENGVYDDGELVNPVPFIQTITSWNHGNVYGPFSHGLNIIPNHYFAEFFLPTGVNGNYGFSAGDRINNVQNATVWVNATQIGISIGNAKVVSQHDGTLQDLDNSKWDIRLVAYWRPER